nr:hypothetical protein [Liquorilactobacillus satsumensis]
MQEELYIPEKTNLQLPLKLLAPIAKHTFNVNLNNLASLIEKLPPFGELSVNLHIPNKNLNLVLLYKKGL